LPTDDWAPPPAGFRVAAFMSAGRWVARCPRCTSAEMRGRCDDGTTGGLDADRFVCRESHGGCGFTCGVDWPSTITQIEALLIPRPPVHRNWQPGETLQDLLAENAEHGIVPTGALEGGPTRQLLAIVGDDVVVGSLESAPQPLELGG
jgi:hypothetical protein